jgi:hypothetical protein
MMRSFCLTILLLAHGQIWGVETAQEAKLDYKAPPHNYWERPPQDAVTAALKKIENGELKVDTSNDRAFVSSLLGALKVPVSSQLLVYSATSMQSGIINPRNPRALYFNDEIYVGFVPGGLVEIMGVDPELGGVFYIFDKPQPGQLPRTDRSTRCFNCHAGSATMRIPGLLAESVAPIISGASYENYRRDEQGHQIPLADRFGGWHVTSAKPFGETKANIFARSDGSGVKIVKVKPGEMWDIEKHLLPSSDILPHLIHEHQIGFDNQVIHAAYIAREIGDKGRTPTLADDKRLNEKASALVRYILFADEAKLPPSGIVGDEQYAKDFLSNKKASGSGLSLKDLDLKTRMFKHRCSYMLYTPQWQKLPALIKNRVYAGMKLALSGKDRNYAYLSAQERLAIVSILRETLPDLPADWR